MALPKGPTRDPDERRFAARTEDHPIEYLDFEGVIPKGEYGAGDSICWDWGTFEPELTWDPGAAVRAGEVKFRLAGLKLAGRFTLVRTGGREAGGHEAGGRGRRTHGGERQDEGDSWLLIAKAGADAIPGWDEDYPASVKTGRTNDEVAADAEPHVDNLPPGPLPTLDPPGSRVLPRPAFIEPMLATPGTAPFDGDDWLFEPKWDGYRVQAIVADGKVALRTRNGNDAGRYFPELLGPPTWLAAPEAIVDGEVVALDADGRPDFGLLQARLGGGFARSDLPASPEAKAAGKGAPLVFMAFDLPWCAGRSYLDVPLEARKEILRLVLREHPRVRYGGHVARDGVAFYAAAAAQGLEGAMAKHRRSRYEAGRRSTAWLKLKVRPTQELVVGGYMPGQGSHHDLGALVVGVMQDGRLRTPGAWGAASTPQRGRASARRWTRGRSRPPVRRRAGGPRRDARRQVGDARPRDPRRDRRLVARRDRPPGDVRPGGAGGRPGIGRTAGGGGARGGGTRPREGRDRPDEAGDGPRDKAEARWRRSSGWAGTARPGPGTRRRRGASGSGSGRRRTRSSRPSTRCRAGRHMAHRRAGRGAHQPRQDARARPA